MLTTQCHFFLSGSASFDFTCLFHTYFNVPDVSKITISGLGGLTYKDKVSHVLALLVYDTHLKLHVYICMCTVLFLHMFIQNFVKGGVSQTCVMA